MLESFKKTFDEIREENHKCSGRYNEHFRQRRLQKDIKNNNRDLWVALVVPLFYNIFRYP